MSDRPKKKKGYFTAGRIHYTERELGYNAACDDWERWHKESLPSVEEIEKVINDHCRGVVDKDRVMLIYGNLAQQIRRLLLGA